MRELGIPSSALPTTVGMRRMLAAAALLVFIIGLPTYLLPEETATLFSWTVNPPITAAFLGGGYLTSMFVEFLASRERTWANARIAVPAVLLFSTLTSIVTFRHLDKFHFGTGSSVFTQLIAWVWLVVYVVVPPLLAFLWWQQVRRSGQTQQHSPRVHLMPGALRVLLGVQAVVMITIGSGLFFASERVGDALWPWPLSALTGGAIGAWLLGVGVGVGHALWENDLRRVRPWMSGYVLFGLLEIVAVVRFAGGESGAGETLIDWGQPRIWTFLLVAVSVVIAAGWALLMTPRDGPPSSLASSVNE